MTRAIEILMKFAKDCSNADESVVSEEARQAAMTALRSARSVRSENAIVYVGIDGGGFHKYFGTPEAARLWVEAESGRHFKTEDLLF